MRKLLIFFSLATSLTLSGCSTMNAGLDTFSGIFSDNALVYQPTILQGNIVTQEQINQLKPGMSRRQVRFILGTPTLQDSFHANRWDYHYTKGIGSEPDEIKHLVVYFNAEGLTHTDGDMQPQPDAESTPVRRASVVKVPDWQDPDAIALWPEFPDLIDWPLDLFGEDTPSF